MRKTARNLIAVGGVLCSVVGLIWTIPLFLNENYIFGFGTSLLIIIGIVLLAIAFGD